MFLQFPQDNQFNRLGLALYQKKGKQLVDSSVVSSAREVHFLLFVDPNVCWDQIEVDSLEVTYI